MGVTARGRAPETRGFDVNAGQDALADVSTGTVTVDDCTGDLLLDVVPGAYDEIVKDWAVASIVVTADGGSLSTDCLGFEVSAAIEHGDVVVVTATDVLTIGAADDTLTLTPATTVFVGDVTNVAVLVDEPNL